MGIMLSYMLCPNTDLSWSLKVQKSSLDWWCNLLVGRCCWMRSTTLNCLLILGLRRCMLCCLPMYVHNTKFSAHFGAKKMHALLSAHVWWPHMRVSC